MESEIEPYSGAEHKTTIRDHIIEFFQTLVVFAVIACTIYLFVAQPHKVSGSSMFPNFKDGDYIVTNKIGYDFGKPQRGQVIVFKNPLNTSQDFIKRVMGLPGDKIRVQDNHVYVNDELVNEPYLPSGTITMSGPFAAEGQEIEIPADHYFVMGDNRIASSDSREWGFVPRNLIIGQAFFRYWPGNEIGIIHQAEASDK